MTLVERERQRGHEVRAPKAAIGRTLAEKVEQFAA